MARSVLHVLRYATFGLTAVTNNTTAMHAEARPAPHRGRVDGAPLIFGVMAGPIAWGLQLLVNYGLASHFCFPGSVPLDQPDGLSGYLRSVLIAVNVVAIAIAIGATAVSFKAWRSTRGELSGGSADLVDIGEGRTRFLAFWGMMTGSGFLLAIVFNLVGVLGLQLCG
jgi:hypothetical protein